MTNTRTTSKLYMFCAGAAIAASLAVSPLARARSAQQPAFTYQGQLKQGGSLVNGNVDLQFRLYDAQASGAQVGSGVALNAVAVTDGLFSASLDFGAASLNGQERWLEMDVRSPAGSANPFVTLGPRQKLASAPYASFALQSVLSGTYGSAVNFSNATNTFNGAFSGSGAGLTNLAAANIAAGTAGINISGNAATATNATNATNATTATTAGSVSGIVGLANGGTGASNAAAALASLGAASASHNHAITSLTGLLGISQLPGGGAWGLTSNLNLDANTLVVDQANNRVGIGLSSPTADLHIRGPAGLANVLITPTTADTVSEISLSENSSNTFGMIMRMDGAANQLQFLANNSGVEQSPVMSIARSATPLIGIGTTAPLSALHVQEGSAGTIAPNATSSLILERSNHNHLQMYSPDDRETGLLFGGDTLDIRGAIISNNATVPNGLVFRTGGNSTRMSIDSTGNVGIGTTTPTAKLEIAGVAGTDGIKFPDGSVQVKASIILRLTTSSFPIQSLARGASTSYQFTVAGAMVGSVVHVTALTDLGSGIMIGPARVSSANTVSFYVHNVSNGPIDPPSTQFTIAVIP